MKSLTIVMVLLLSTSITPAGTLYFTPNDSLIVTIDSTRAVIQVDGAYG